MAISITVGAGMGTSQSQMAAQMQQAMADQQRMKVLAGVNGGSINQNEFRDLANSLSLPRDQGPTTAPTTQPTAEDAAAAKKAADELKAAREQQGGAPGLPGFGGMGMANQAAQFQMMATDQKQAQSIYEQIAARAKNFNSLYDKYSNGDFQPQQAMDPAAAARLDQTFTQFKGGQINAEQALAAMRQ